MCQVVERWCQFSRRRVDLFNFADIVAVKPDTRGVLFVQTTSGSNVSARIAKMKGIAGVGICLAAGNPIVVHGWRKTGKKGKRKTWTLREVNFADEITPPIESEPNGEI